MDYVTGEADQVVEAPLEGLSPEERESLRHYVEKRTKKGQRALYRVLAREPGVSRGEALDLFSHIWEARDFIKDIVGRYPEGTLLYITHGDSGGLKETYLVSESGEAVKRSGRGWIPFS